MLVTMSIIDAGSMLSIYSSNLYQRLNALIEATLDMDNAFSSHSYASRLSLDGSKYFVDSLSGLDHCCTDDTHCGLTLFTVVV